MEILKHMFTKTQTIVFSFPKHFIHWRLGFNTTSKPIIYFHRGSETGQANY
jgi:hypothetical protein